MSVAGLEDEPKPSTLELLRGMPPRLQTVAGLCAVMAAGMFVVAHAVKLAEGGREADAWRYVQVSVPLLILGVGLSVVAPQWAARRTLRARLGRLRSARATVVEYSPKWASGPGPATIPAVRFAPGSGQPLEAIPFGSIEDLPYGTEIDVEYDPEAPYWCVVNGEIPGEPTRLMRIATVTTVVAMVCTMLASSHLIGIAEVRAQVGSPTSSGEAVARWAHGLLALLVALAAVDAWVTAWRSDRDDRAHVARAIRVAARIADLRPSPINPSRVQLVLTFVLPSGEERAATSSLWHDRPDGTDSPRRGDEIEILCDPDDPTWIDEVIDRTRWGRIKHFGEPMLAAACSAGLLVALALR